MKRPALVLRPLIMANSGVTPYTSMRRVTGPAVTTARVSPTGDMAVISSLPSNHFASSRRMPRERCCFARSIRSGGVFADITSTPSSPKSSMPCHTAAETPSRTDITTTMASVPSITPRSVKMERSGWPFTSSRLVRIDSVTCMASLRPQRGNWVEARGADGRVHAEEQARAGGEDERIDARHERDDRRRAQQHADAGGEALAGDEPQEAAEERDEDRLAEELEEDLRRRRADGLARADFAHPLVEGRELDVHHYDAAHDERDDSADHEERVVHPVLLLVAAEVRHAREDFEVAHAVLALEDAFDLVHRLHVFLDVAHARVHEADLPLLQRLALARDERGERGVDLAVHPAHHVALLVDRKST